MNPKLLKRLSLIFLTSFFISNGLRSQELIVIESVNLKCNDSVLVFTPKGYYPDKAGETPALYLLHGWSGNYRNWGDKTDIQAMSDKYGFIIITPDGFYNSWYLNNVDKDKMQWRTFFDEELYPLIKLKFNLNPEKTFITGLSMGGHGAINIYMDDTTRFKAAGSMSGVLNLHDTRLKETQMAEVLGPYAKENGQYDLHSAVNRLESIKGGKDILLISCGAQDGLAQSSRDFSKRCDELKIPYMLMISPGVHSWPYWIYMLDQHLFIFDRIDKGKGLGY